MPSLIHEPIAIVGMSCRLPGADNLDEFWQLLRNGESAIGEFPDKRLDRDLYYDPEKGVQGKTYSTLGGLIKERPLNPNVLPLDPCQFDAWDPCHLIMAEVACAACQHAGYDVNNMPLRENTGVYIGHSGGSSHGTELVYGTLAAEMASYLNDAETFRTLPLEQQQHVIAELTASIRNSCPRRNSKGDPAVEASAAALLVARTLRLGGPHLVTDAACASSLVALMMGVLAVQSQQVDMAVVGGASYNKSDSLILFSQARSCSATGTCPFDDDADGLISSEGYVAVLIKTLARARADGDTVQAVITGLGVSSDGRGRSLWAPRKEGQIRAMQRAYGDRISPDTVQYVEAHATSTQIGDATEMQAMTEFFADRLSSQSERLPVGSVKSNIGHTLETAGMASLLKTVLAMQNGVIPPTINLKKPNQTIPWQDVPFFVPTKPMNWPSPPDNQPRRAAVSAFGIGGLNVHVIIENEQHAYGDLSGFAAGKDGVSDSHDGALPTNGKRPTLHVVQSTSEPTPPVSIAIIGRGVVLPDAYSVDSFSQLIASGHVALRDAPHQRWRDRSCVQQGASTPWRTTTLRGGFITDYAFDWKRYRIPPKQIARANPLQFMLLDAARQAVQEAGYDEDTLDREQTAVVVGTIFGGEFGHDLVTGLRLPDFQQKLEHALSRQNVSSQRISEIAREFTAALLQGKPAMVDETGSFTSSTLASRVSKELDLMGGAMAIDAGECSSLAALDVACNLLRSTACRQVLCAGAQRAMDIANYEALTLEGRLPSFPGGPGNVPGEGVVMLLLKRLVDAEADGDRVLGIIRHVEGSHDSCHFSQAIQRAGKRLLQRSKVAVDDVTSVTSGTKNLAQPEERQSLEAAYEIAKTETGKTEYCEPIFVDQIGHMLAAQGLVSLVDKTIRISQSKVHSQRDQVERHVLNNYNPSGLVYQVLLEEPTPQLGSQTTRPRATDSQTTLTQPNENRAMNKVFRFGAHSPNALSELLTDACHNASEHFRSGVERTFQTGDTFRLVVFADSPERLNKRLDLASRQWHLDASRSVLAVQGVVYGQLSAQRPQVAFLFPGQGAQYSGMLQQLPQTSGAANQVLNAANRALSQIGSKSFNDMAWNDAEELGKDIWANQITVLVADLMAWGALCEAGVTPDRVCGHSFGEFAAMVAAGVCDIDQAIRLTQARAQAITTTIEQHGALLSLAATATNVRSMIAACDSPVTITHFNAPDQTVVGGTLDQVEHFKQFADSAGLVGQILKVPCAFHTSLMAPAQEPLRRAFLSESATPTSLTPTSPTPTRILSPSKIPWLVNVGCRYVADPDEVRERLVDQLVEPVQYMQLVTRLADEGVSLFIEVGPRQILTQLNQRILADRDRICMALDSPRQSPADNIAQILAQMECLGIPVSTAQSSSTQSSGTQSSGTQSSSGAASVDRSATRHAIEHFDATQRRKQHQRSHPSRTRGPHSAATEAIARTIEQFDATATRRQQGSQRANRVTNVTKGSDQIHSTNSRPLNGAHHGELVHANLEQFLINFVVEHTGYPAEILELDWDLEADLGIDSIKKAQLFGELREFFDLENAINIESQSRFSLDEFRTLRNVLELLERANRNGEWTEARDALATEYRSSSTDDESSDDRHSINHAPTTNSGLTWASSQQAVNSHEPSVPAQELEQFLVNFVVEHTGYPPEIVELDADFEADLGIDSIKKAQLFGELREHFEIRVEGGGRFALEDFRTLRSVLDLLLSTLSDDHVSPYSRTTIVTEQITRNRNPVTQNATPATRMISGPATSRNNGSTSHFNTDAKYSKAYQRGFQWGQGKAGHILQTVQDAIDQSGAFAACRSNVSTVDLLQQEFASTVWDEIQGIADGAGLHVASVAAHFEAIIECRGDLTQSVDVPSAKSTHGNGRAAHDSSNRMNGQSKSMGESNGSESNGKGKSKSKVTEATPATEAAPVTYRHILRMTPAPQRRGPVEPELAGAGLILGTGPICAAIQQRMRTLGQASYVIDPSTDPMLVAAEVERIWAIEPTPHLFIITPREADSATTFDTDDWLRRRSRGLMSPYWVCQRWLRLTNDAGLLGDGSLVAVASLGGDFGVSGEIGSSGNRIAAESGGLTGLLKSIVIESWMNGHRTLPIKVIDAPFDEPPQDIVDGIFRELAVPSYAVEVSWSKQQRRTIQALRRPIDDSSRHSPIPRGGNWVCTGGGRGITAYVVKELGHRYGLTINLLGTAPLPQIPDSWRELTDDGVKALKLEVMTSARAIGRNPIKEWQRTEKALEIDKTLRELKRLGVSAQYFQCDVACRDSLGSVLARIRRQHGPIDAVLHGAGVGKDGRFDNKDPEKVDQCIRAKVDGTLALMALTQDDPLKYFVAFGSISGRFGANGHTDYSLSNDMMSKLVDWYRHQRPEVGAVAFHWHAWGDVGMATKPETRLALEMIGMQFMPAAEGLAHLIRELEAGAPEGEVLITDDRYYRLFYPAETLVATTDGVSNSHQFPLLDRGKTVRLTDDRIQSGETTTIALHPATDPFLVEHRLDDKPLLPIVAGLELLCEAAARMIPLSIPLASAMGWRLANIRAHNGLRFHTDQPHYVSVAARMNQLGRADCELVADVVARNGKTVELQRPYLSATIERLASERLAGAPQNGSVAGRLHAPDGEWHQVDYPERQSRFYLGPPFRCLRKFRLSDGVGWGRITAPAAIELTGPKHSVTGWIVPCAALDACLYATGLLAWFTVEPGVALPESIAQLTLGRFPDPGESCFVETRFKRREDHFGWFDFSLYGVDGDLLIEAKDYRIVWLPSTS